MRLYDSFFHVADEEEKSEEHLIRSREALDWTGQAYHKQFLGWLERESGRPLKVKESHGELIESAVRANTLREVRDYLSRLEREAQDAIRPQEGEHRDAPGD